MLPLRARNIPCLFLVCVSWLIHAQTTAKPAGQSKTANDAKTSESPQKPAPSPLSTLQGKVTSDLNALNGPGDYVKCEFTREQLLSLRPEPTVYLLTAADEDQIRITVITEAFDPSNATVFQPGQANAFANDLNTIPLVGRTRAQALATILDTLEKHSATPLVTKALGSTKEYAQYLSDTYGVPIDEATKQLTHVPQSATPRINAATALSDSIKKPGGQEALTNDTKAAAAFIAAAPQKNAIADAARQATSALSPPLDVACSMSVLSYRTNKYAFGEKVAREYIPVQIVVRNLNPDKEFLVQDAEFAAETDINGRHGRYAAGIDKLTVRTFMLASHDYAPVPFIIHAAEGAGIVLSSVSLIYGPAVKDAANVYNAGFITALHGVLPDHSTEQLNLLNDEGFSAYRTERTVVPKSGTAEFVIFVQANQFANAWWTQDCAQTTIIKLTHKKGDYKQTAACIGAMNEDKDNPKCFGDVGFIDDPGIGVDLSAVRQVCLDNSTASKKHMWKGVQTDDENAVAYLTPKKVDYKKWSPAALQLFRELSYTVVAGTHIVEESSTKPTLSKISCPTNDKGDVDVSKAANNTLNCPLTGTNLDQIENLKLRNAANQADKSATATVSTTSGGDSKSTTAAFPLDQICALNAKSYKAYTITKDGADSDSGLQLNFSLSPTVLGSPSPAQVDLSKLPQALMFNGCHLDKVKTLKLSAAEENAPITIDSGVTSTEAKFTLTQDNMKPFANLETTKNKQLAVGLVDSDGSDVSLGESNIGVSGKLAVATPPKKNPPKKSSSPQKPGGNTGH